MKKKYKVSIKGVVFLILLTSFSGSIYGQSGDWFTDYSMIKARSTINKLDYNNIEGNPYHTENYVKSLVFFPSGDSVVVDLRYDLYANELEFLKNGKEMWVEKNKVAKVIYGEDKMAVASIPGDKTTSWLFLVEEGDYSLLKKKGVVFQPSKPAGAYADPIPDRFQSQNDVFYIKHQDKPLRSMMTSRDLRDFLTDNPAASEYVKKNRIRHGREAELILLVRYLNAL